MSAHSLIKGPKVTVTFDTDTDLVQKVTLKPSEGFNVIINQTASPSLRHQILDWIESYLNKKSAPLPPLNFETLTPFASKVLYKLSEVSIGNTVSYGMLAHTVRSQAFRAVGSVCKKNPFPLIIPCHRVIKSNQEIGHFFYGTALKKELLTYEGALQLK